MRKSVKNITWQRNALLAILAYEVIGCIIGGTLLIISPDGSKMEMPVHIMHGIFKDFLIPGIILFALGIINSFAFISVYRKTSNDWRDALLSMTLMIVWFTVEILILRELHWLHAMWGLPVLYGWVLSVPLMKARLRHKAQKLLLFCGITASLWFAAINYFIPIVAESYDPVRYTVSELFAVNTSTRILWVLLVIPHFLLLAAFGWGVLGLAEKNTRLRAAGILLIIYSVLNFYWPPMHQRETIASGGGARTDILHIGWTLMGVILNLLIIWLGALGLPHRFRLFSVICWVVVLTFGIITIYETPAMFSDDPTPYIGLWERIALAAFDVWLLVFAVSLVRQYNMIVRLRI